MRMTVLGLRGCGIASIYDIGLYTAYMIDEVMLITKMYKSQKRYNPHVLFCQFMTTLKALALFRQLN